MEATAKNTEAFLQSIRTLATAECERIDRETESVRAERLQAMQTDARKRYKSYMEYEAARIRAEANREISKKGEASRKTLSDLRAALSRKVFERAKEKIEAYTETDEYHEKLLADVREIAALFADGDTELFIAPRDADRTAEIETAYGAPCTVTVTGTIALGGVKALDRKTHRLADNTLDTALEAQKAWFLENSGLSVEE
ncbi:MAG: V-type ATP synthase subunit E [Candidatus Fimenecus sp.]